MKTLRILALAALAILAGFNTSMAQTADELVAKHVAATGGAENWKKVKSVKMVGDAIEDSVVIPMTLIYVQNKAMKVESAFGGMNTSLIFTKKGAWTQEMGGKVPMAMNMTPEELKELKDKFDLMPLVNYKTKGIKIVYLGQEDVRGTKCYKIKLTFPGGLEQTWSLDKDYNHIRTIEKSNADGQESEKTTDYSHFRKMPEGVIMPMEWETGEAKKVEFKSIEINKVNETSIFKAPIK